MTCECCPACVPGNPKRPGPRCQLARCPGECRQRGALGHSPTIYGGGLFLYPERLGLMPNPEPPPAAPGF